MVKYVYDGDASSISINEIKQFLTDFKNGELTVHLKSESVPENKGPLTILVGKNF